MTGLFEAVYLVVASVALILAVIALLQLIMFRREIRHVLGTLNSRVLRHVVKSIEKRRRFKNRYLVVRLISSSNIGVSELQKRIDEAFIELYGRRGYSEASPRVLYFSEKTSKAVIRVRNHYRWSVLLALAYLERKELLTQVFPERITGTYKKAKRYAETT